MEMTASMVTPQRSFFAVSTAHGKPKYRLLSSTITYPKLVIITLSPFVPHRDTYSRLCHRSYAQLYAPEVHAGLCWLFSRGMDFRVVKPVGVDEKYATTTHTNTTPPTWR